MKFIMFLIMCLMSTMVYANGGMAAITIVDLKHDQYDFYDECIYQLASNKSATNCNVCTLTSVVGKGSKKSVYTFTCQNPLTVVTEADSALENFGEATENVEVVIKLTGVKKPFRTYKQCDVLPTLENNFLNNYVFACNKANH